MGCGSSKLKQSKCKAKPKGFSSRSYSMFVHHPPSKEGDSYHVVALTSTTLGSLSLDPSFNNPRPHYASFNGRLHLHTEGEGEGEGEKKRSKAGFEVDMMEAKAWSNMIHEKMDKMETINAWEMMEGLEEEEDDDDVIPPAPAPAPAPAPRIRESENEDDHVSSGDDCFSNAGGKVESDEFDTQVISAFRKALGELSPTNPFRLSKVPQDEFIDAVEDVKKVNGALEMHLPFGDGTKLNISIDKDKEEARDEKKEKLVLYSTSLRGIRKTYEDCCDVKLIFKGLGVRVDERDVSMHSAFKEELRDLLLLGETGHHKLPRVFVGDKYIGGADDIRRMDEEGTLRKVCEFVQQDDLQAGCKACGDIRFVPCETCSGSCKVYYEEQVQVDEEDGEFGFHRCPHCNENGLIRCPICCH